ncbi:MAG: MtrAB system histidine kinase MtrB [Actinomycetaceae bacterium]|nr:MtrAB system histidine kinase MtrB [Arcanobacterium sp.]MDD7505160.1 MtrAB system histidine kinase MtrB [Actinomycetaceae bacterium]
MSAPAAEGSVHVSASQAGQPKGRIFSRISLLMDAFTTMWRSSLRMRVMTLVAVGGLIGITLTGVLVTTFVKNSVYSQATDSIVEQFASDARGAQESFVSQATPTLGQSQQAANAIVSSMYDPNRGLLGAVLLRATNHKPVLSQIVEPETGSTISVRSLVTTEIRQTIAGSDVIAWQPVAIPTQGDAVRPGVVVGTSLVIPAAGNYELYAVYSLQTQQDLLSATYRSMTAGVVAMLFLFLAMAYVFVRTVLHPLKEVSSSASRLAEGELATRMDVRGTDELSQVAVSFNKMAESIENQFDAMEKMSQVQTNFVSAVSHELRSPVTTIRMAGQLIYDKRDELPPALRRSAELQHDQVINLDSMLSDLLEISRYDAGGMNLAIEAVDVAEIVAHVVESTEPLARDNNVSVTCSVEGETTAEVEPRRIERIVRNLVTNALEHAESRPVNIRVVGSSTAIAVEVRDHGVGLSEEQTEHVFDRFWRADTSRVRKTGGTGLGLTLAMEDAQMHGGVLEAAGTLGVGSVFLLTIPRELGAEFTKPIPLRSPEADGVTSTPSDGDSTATPGASNEARAAHAGEDTL